jgi:hypothetical protein
MTTHSLRFAPRLEPLDDRVNPSALAGATPGVGDYTPTTTRQITIVEDLQVGRPGLMTLEGQECLVFFLGGIPSAEPTGGPKYWVFGTEVPGVDADDSAPRRRNLVTLHSMDNSNGPIPFRDVNDPARYSGTHVLYQDFVIPVNQVVGPYVFVLDGRGSGM